MQFQASDADQPAILPDQGPCRRATGCL